MPQNNNANKMDTSEKNVAPENILFEAIAILILSTAAFVTTRLNQVRKGESEI